MRSHRFPLGTPARLKRAIRHRLRKPGWAVGLASIHVPGPEGPAKWNRTPHGRKVIARRRAANKVARASRKANRG